MSRNDSSHVSLEQTGRFLAFKPILRALGATSAITAKSCDEYQAASTSIQSADGAFYLAVSSGTSPQDSYSSLSHVLLHQDYLASAYKAALSGPGSILGIVDNHAVRDSLASLRIATASSAWALLPTNSFSNCATTAYLAIIKPFIDGDKSKDRELLDNAGSDVAHYLRVLGDEAKESVLLLTRAIREFFPKAALSFGMVTDPEEHWRKLVVSVATTLDDLEKRMAAEDELYSHIDGNNKLGEAMGHVVISFL